MFTRAKPDPIERPKRFYKLAAAREVEGGFGVTLDGRALKTPAARPLVLPTLALAELVAGEWQAQETHILAAEMHASRLAFTAIDRVADAREAVADEVASFASADLLCYFATAPESLALRQAELWRPQLDWAETKLGLKLVTAEGVNHQAQPEGTIDVVRALALRLDNLALTALAHAAALFGSTVLAFAVERGHLTGARAFELSRLDEAFQEEHWGVDADAARRTALLQVEAAALDAWFAGLRA